jgi:hypothetical protein
LTAIELASQLELAQLSGIVDARGRFLNRAGQSTDTLITIHLGPDQTPQVARLWRRAWPTVTALNFSQGREFHVRLRQHQASGVCLVYGSVSITPKNRHQHSIFAEVVQRGRLCRNLSQVHAAIETIKKELGIPPFGGTSPTGGSLPPLQTLRSNSRKTKT